MTTGLLGLMLLLAGQAFAAPKNTYIVLPFSIQGPQEYAYLQRSVPQMLTSRLYWKDNFEPAREIPANTPAVTSEAEAEKLRAQYKADYVIWGSVTVAGTSCSVDVRVRDKSGKIWPQARDAHPSQIIGAVNGISDSINQQVFGRSAQPSSASQGGGRINQMNPGISVNQTQPGEVYLNPQFRYSGANVETDSRLRSQALNFASIGMEVVDADGDGKNEIVLLSERMIHVYKFTNGNLTPLAELKFPMNSKCLSLRALPHPSGRPWLIVNLVDQFGVPMGSILTFNGASLVEELKNIRYYLNVVNLPPNFQPILIGQQAKPPRLFMPGVYEMIKQGNSLEKGRRLGLPEGANVFNFSYMPATRGEPGSEKLIVLTKDENLRVFDTKNNRIGQTSEKYSGSFVGMEVDPSMPGLGKDDVIIPETFYIPMRILPIDLERDGKWEILVNKPISMASQIFDRYRFFPESEIHSLFWDGLGLSLQWKTRRIKGSMADYAIADPNNDGIMDLVTCLNTHPGVIGVKERKTVIMLYPLDLSQTDPNTRPYSSEDYNR